MPHTSHVALLIESSRAYGRGLLHGIIRYQQEHRPWSIYFQPRGTDDPAPAWLESWRGNGILARVADRKMAATIRRTGIPAVDLSFRVHGLKMPAVGIDNDTIVRLVLDHFLDRGFRQFAFCGFPSGDLFWMDVRAELFQRLVSEAGLKCALFTGTTRAGRKRSWEQDQKQLAQWVRRLPKPIAVMACNDDRGLQLLDACSRANVRVPDDVSVIGVDNDEFLCGLARPPLSSVDINVEGVGYRAAELLDGLMRGQPSPDEPLLLPARAVIARQSTDSLAIDDPQLSMAVSYLRDHACEGIRMSDVARATGMKRRTLERRMKAVLGRTPKAELLNIQLYEAKRLLVDTDLSIKAISLNTGFANSRYFSQVFRARVGQAPGRFRQSARDGTSTVAYGRKLFSKEEPPQTDTSQ